MKKFLALLCLGLVVPMVSAQETNDVEQLKRQMLEMQQNYEKEHNEERQLIKSLSEKVDALLKGAPPQATVSVTQTNAAADAEKAKLAAELAGELGPVTNQTSAEAMPKKSWSPAEPITIARAGSAYMNISFDALMDAGGSSKGDPSAQLELGDHDPIKNGFSLRNAEIAVDGAVDPYLKGFGNIVLKLDKNNNTDIELEEAYAQTTALPGNL